MDSSPESTPKSSNIKSPSSPIIFSSRLRRKTAKRTPSAPEQIMKEIKQMQNANKFNYTVPVNNQSTQIDEMEHDSNKVYPVFLERVSDDTPQVLHNSETIVAEPCASNLKTKLNSAAKSKPFVFKDNVKVEDDENCGFLTLTQILNLEKPNCNVNNETTTENKGFKTASGKTINVLETALTHARSIFKDIVTDTGLPNQKRDNNNDVENDLQKSEGDKINKLAKTVISGSAIKTPLSNSTNRKNSLESSKKLGGPPATKKKLIEVSPAALKAASRLFEDINSDFQRMSNCETQIYNTPKRCSYTTNNASDKSSMSSSIKSKTSFSNTPLRLRNSENENVRQNLNKIIGDTQNIEKEANYESEIELKIDLDDIKLEDDISMSQFYVTDTEMLLAAENADAVWDIQNVSDSIDIKYEDIKPETISRESNELDPNDFASDLLNQIQPNEIFFKENEIRNNIPVVYSERTFENFYGQCICSPPARVNCSDDKKQLLQKACCEDEKNTDFKKNSANVQISIAQTRNNNQNTITPSQKATKKLNIKVIENKLIENFSNQTSDKTASTSNSLDVNQPEELLKNNEIVQKNDFGFQTASGIKVHVNKKAFQAAQNLFQDIYEENSNCKEKAPVNNIGFQTASGNKVIISEEAQKAASALFQNINNETVSNISNENSKLGFHTASDNTVTINEKAKRGAQKLFKDIDCDSNTANSSKINKEYCKVGFHTASGNEVGISDEAKKAATKWFEKINISNICSENISTPNNKDSCTTKNSFQLREVSANKNEQSNLNSVDANINEMSGQNKIRSSIIENASNCDTNLIDHVKSKTLENKKTCASERNVTQEVSKKRKRCNSEISVPNKVLKPSDSLDIHNTVNNVVSQNICAVEFKVEINDSDTEYDAGCYLHRQETVLDKEIKLLVRLYQSKTYHLSLLKNQRELLQKALVKDNVQHIPGYLWRSRENKKMSLVEAFKELPSSINNRVIPESLLNITSENADKMKFKLLSRSNNSVYQLKLDDDAVIVVASDNKVGVHEFDMALKTMPGVNAKLIPKNWTRNHFRWIVWKLASLERQFSVPFLNPRTIMLELKYRYDRDIYENHRSALRMIYEKDDTPARRMVLCVSKIKNGDVELTDGWYSILAEFDLPLLEMIDKRKIVCGTKLITQGAHLLNLEEACHPLEARINVRLKIHFNSTRRARWDTKLGYQPNPGPFPVSLKTIKSRGGSVGCVKAYIVRVFPIKYMEKIDARWTCFCSKAHIKREIEHKKNKEDSLDRAQYQAQKELEKEWAVRLGSGKNTRIPKRTEIPEVRCAKTLSAILKKSSDPESIAKMMSPSQHAAVANYQFALNEEKQRELEARVNKLLENEVSVQRGFISCVLQIKIVDDPNNNEGMNLDIWSPNENIVNILKEGTIMNIFNLSVNAKSDSVHLSATKNTRYQISSTNSAESYLHFRRHYTSICDLQLQNITLRFRYVDTVGYIAKIEYNQPTTTVWLADLDYKLLRIQCYLDPTRCMVLDGYMEGELVAAINLYSLAPLLGQAQALASWETIVTTRPQHGYLSSAVCEIQWKVSNNNNFEEYLSKCKNIIENWKKLLDKQGRQIKPFSHNPLPLETNK